MTKIFNGIQEAELKNISLGFFLPWNEILPPLSKSIFLRPGEEIAAFEITEDGINIKLIKKRGRNKETVKKVSKKKDKKVADTIKQGENI